MSAQDDRARAVRLGLIDQLRPVASAWSVNGRDVVFLAGFDLGAEIGGFLSLTLQTGERLLVQVQAQVRLPACARDALNLFRRTAWPLPPTRARARRWPPTRCTAYGSVHA
jgi:hypothetical protein